MDILSFLKEASVQLGPSGQEREVAEWLAERFRPLADSVCVDSLFNVIALKKGTGGDGAPKIMFCAHQDEIALMVAEILPDGTLRMGQVGGVDPRILPASQVLVHATGQGFPAQKLKGVVGSKPPHLLGEAERKRNYNREKDLFVDLGMAADRVKAAVNLGDLITLVGETVGLLNDRAAGKTMDDRACVAIMLDAAERLQTMRHQADVYFVCSSQEEVGGYGARAAAHTIDPDLAVVLDVTHASIPQSRPDTCVALDAPSLAYGPFIQHRLLDKLKAVAEKHRVKVNWGHTEARTGTDTDTIQVVREGIPCVIIGLPLKYMHTAVELLDINAIRESGRLSAHFAREIEKGWEEDIWS